MIRVVRGLFVYCKAVKILVSLFNIAIMGNSITQAIKEKQEENDAEVTETLQMMHKMMENKIAASSSKVHGIVDSGKFTTCY